MNLINLIKKIKLNIINISFILLIGLFLRIYYLLRKTGNIFKSNLGGDSCYHYNVAQNISDGLGPKTSFIFSYWFPHQNIPAMTDLYGPGYHYFLSIFLLLKNEFIILRISSLLVGTLSILLAYFIGQKLKSKTLGFISASVICFNFFHIENSTVVMRENFNLLLVQLFFLNLIYIKQSRFLFASIGLIIGYTAMTSGVWIVLVITYFIYYFKNFKIYEKNFFSNLSIVFIFFILIIFPWAKTSYDYFGKTLFNYMSIYPYIEDWGTMMSERGIPNVQNFWSEVDFFNYLKKHFFWSLNNIYKFCLILFPTFAFPISFSFIPLILIGAYKLKFNGFLLIFFSVFYFLALSFGTNATNGILWPRHFMPFLATTSVLLSYGLIIFFETILKIKNLKNKLKFIFAHKLNKFIFLIPIIITLAGIEVKDSFWERDSSFFYEFGKKIQNNTLITDKIMYANTVPDAWCVTKREIVQDPAFYKNKTSSRILDEVKRFNVEYLLIDVSNHIYQRGSDDIDNVIKFYDKLQLKNILEDKKNGFYFYRIIN